MKIETLSGIFALISDAWSNFKPPTHPVIFDIWDKALSPHSEESIMQAIATLYKRDHFFSFAALMGILGDISKAELLPKADVIAIIDRLSSNSRQDISDQPEIVKETIRQAGGLVHLGSREWDEWTHKALSEAYDDAVKMLERKEVQALSAPDRLRIE